MEEFYGLVVKSCDIFMLDARQKKILENNYDIPVEDVRNLVHQSAWLQNTIKQPLQQKL